MKLTIEIEMDNAAFEDGNGTEAARILTRLAEKLADRGSVEYDDWTLFDVNGNVVGLAKVDD